MRHGGNVWSQGGPDRWLDFSANLRAEGAPGWVMDAMRAAMEHVGYYPDTAMTAARRGIARALGLPAECVMSTAGGIAALEMACAGRTGEALIFDPAFGEYERLCAQNGLTVRRTSLLSYEHCFGTLIGIAERHLTPGMTVWLNNPNNPIGCAFDRAEVIALLDCVERVGGRLIVDEAFIGYCPEHSVADLVRERPALLIAGSLTKTLGIPGVRLGYLCAHPSVLTGIEKNAMPWTLNCFAASVAAQYADHPAGNIQDALTNAQRRGALAEGLKALGAFVYPSRANYLLAAFDRPVGPIARRLKREEILLRQCMNFRGIDDGYHLRMAVKRTGENGRLLCALRAALE